MNAVLADTGYWVALLNGADALHPQARALAASLTGTEVVTTDLVLVETLNYFAEQGAYWRGRAAKLVIEINKNPMILVAPFTRGLFEEAFQRYQARPDKAWSLADCLSFVIMEQNNLTDALAHDIHFVQAGFRALLRE